MSFLRKQESVCKINLSILLKMQLIEMKMSYKKKRYVTFIIMVVILFACSKDKNKEVVLARVGEDVITVKDFRNNYETGFPHLKKKPDPKRSYLDYMIKEKLLSLDGYKRGFDQAPRVKKYEKELLNELLIEQVFTKEVGSKINITSEQIKDAITKAKVSWKMRYWFEPNEQSAKAICEAMRKEGYTEILDKILKKNPELPIKPKDLTTQYVTYLDVPDNVLNAIKDLPVGDISDPVLINGVYYIFQVLDVRRDMITDFDYKNGYEKYRQILYYRQLKKDAEKYVHNLVSSKTLKFKSAPFNILAKALTEWKESDALRKKDFKEVVMNAKDKSSNLFKLNEELNSALLTVDGKPWTVKDVLDRGNIWRDIKINPRNPKSIRPRVADELALQVRNKYLLQKADEMDLKDEPSVQNELKSWRDKWVYKEARNYYLKDVRVKDKSIKNYLQEIYADSLEEIEKDSTYKNIYSDAKRHLMIDSIRHALDLKIDSLKKVYPVWINEAVLDTIKVVQSEKTHTIDLQVYKRSSNRMAVPIVDPTW